MNPVQKQLFEERCQMVWAATYAANYVYGRDVLDSIAMADQAVLELRREQEKEEGK